MGPGGGQLFERDGRDVVDPQATRTQAGDAAKDIVRNSLALKRMGSVDDMVGACLYLLSDDASWVTGQILAGVNPGEAVRYQMVIVFMITAAATLGTVIVLLLAFRMLFSARHQLLLNRLSAKQD